MIAPQAPCRSIKDGKHGGRAPPEQESQIARPAGAVVRISKAKLVSAQPMPVSLMPPGLDQTLEKEELRNLMAYLLKEKP